MSPDKTIFVLVAVTGVEDERAAESAIHNLSNAEQNFYPTMTLEVEDQRIAEAGDPVIYFP